MKELGEYTVEQLEAEISKRSKPKLQVDDRLNMRDTTKLKKLATRFIDAIATTNGEAWSHADFEEYTFEVLIEIFYGIHVWDWIKAQV